MPRHSSQRKLGVGNTAGAANAPAFFGRVDNTVEALHLVRAAQLDVVPRIRQRLNSEEREAMVISGAVFVFNVNEASMKRWTDGKIWSPSRIDGNFLLYRELSEKKEAVVVVSDRFEEWSPVDDMGAAGSRSKARGSRSPAITPTATEPAPTAGGFKPGGLLKKTITVKISSIDHHLVAYYTQEDLDVGNLQTISRRADIMHIPMPSNIFHFSEFRLPPRVVQGTGGQPPKIVCEPETMETAVVQGSVEPWHAEGDFPGTPGQTGEILGMNLAWSADRRHEPMHPVDTAHVYRAAPDAARGTVATPEASSPETHQDTGQTSETSPMHYDYRQGGEFYDSRNHER
ncbi:hypothetical protein HWV62_11806 [Athelia sp. TMB]|nr:hypothetical protein HWV62_11806 [Athelia sp. TMB]